MTGAFYALAFTALAALPVLVAWRAGNQMIDRTDYGFHLPPQESPVARSTHRHVGETMGQRTAGGDLPAPADAPTEPAWVPASVTRGGRVGRRAA